MRVDIFGKGVRDSRELVRIERLAEFAQHRRHLIEPADLIGIADKVEGGRLGRRDADRAARRIEGLHRDEANTAIASSEGASDTGPLRETLELMSQTL